MGAEGVLFAGVREGVGAAAFVPDCAIGFGGGAVAVDFDGKTAATAVFLDAIAEAAGGEVLPTVAAGKTAVSETSGGDARIYSEKASTSDDETMSRFIF